MVTVTGAVQEGAFAGSQAPPPPFLGAGRASEDWSEAEAEAGKELSPPPARQSLSEKDQLAAAAAAAAANGSTRPAWRRLGSWLLSVFKSDPKWKGMIDKPLADFECECCPALRYWSSCPQLPPLSS